MALKYTIQLDRYSIQIADSEWSGSSMEISPNVIQSVNFDIEGENNDITAPIIKTSLSMTFVDAPDLPEAGTMKCGDWEEFYTPDARRWKVSIIEDGDAVWAGFITPDSYTEELRYRGSVTLIARDGIGMLDDIMFDAEGNDAGMITPAEIVNVAVSRIGTYMTVTFGEGEADAWLQTAGGTMGYDTYIPVAAFKDKSWYEALEEVLIAYGACMRFINGHAWAVVSLRYLPKLRQLSWHGSDKTETPLFSAYATREMVPAVRSIHEVVDYEVGDGKLLPMADAFSFTGAVSYYTYTTYNGGVTTIQAPIHPITSNSVWSGSMYFNSDRYGYDKVANGLSENAIFIPMFEYQYASSGLNKAIFTYPLSKTSGVLKMSIGTPHVLINGEFKTAPQELMPTPQFTLIVQLHSDDGTYYYYNGEAFTTTYAEYKCMPKDGLIEIPLSVDGLSGDSFTLNIMFYYIGVAGVTAYEYYQGMYACINSMSLERIGTQSYLSTNRVNTIYSESNNVKIDRNPMIGPAFNNAIVPSIIKNGIFDTLSSGAYVPAPTWRYAAGGSSQQLAVYNHLAIIPYYARPHNLLQGTILRGSNVIDPNIIWVWNGQKHLMLSGSFDLLSGRINRAVLHEYDTYDSLWGYTSSSIPDVTISTEFSDSTNSGGSSSGGSGGGGGTSVTIDSAMSDTSENAVQNKVIKAYVDAAVSGGSIDTTMSGTSANAVQNKVIKSYVDDEVSELRTSMNENLQTEVTAIESAFEDVNSSIDTIGPVTVKMGIAPKLKLEYSDRMAEYYFFWNHPWYGMEGAEIVLMHYNRYASRKFGEKYKHTKAWRVAHGRKAQNESINYFTNTVNFSKASLLNYLTQSWLNLWNTDGTQADDITMTLLTYETMRAGTWQKYALRNTHSDNKSKIFGWAVRIPNPAFAEQVDSSRDLTEATTEINGVPRYIYSDIIPMRVYVSKDKEDKISIGFRFTE